MQNNFELKLERVLDAPRNLVWRCWTEPQHLMPWFTPAPWKTVEARCDLKVGGEFFNLMQSPEGEKHPNHGVYLEIKDQSRLVWTNAFRVGWVPNGDAQPLLVTVTLDFADAGTGKTLYTARALHWNADAVKQHETMGFHDGWNVATDQLVAHAQSLR